MNVTSGYNRTVDFLLFVLSAVYDFISSSYSPAASNVSSQNSDFVGKNSLPSTYPPVCSLQLSEFVTYF
jgi:hypothetical protein